MEKETALVDTSQTILQLNDLGQLNQKGLERLLNIILPALEKHHRDRIMAQSLDKRLTIDIKDEWNFNYEEWREKNVHYEEYKGGNKIKEKK